METTSNNRFNWVKNSVGLKISIIGFIILLMLIPSFMIKDLMRERQGRHREAVREVTQKWGESQRIGGVILTVPCIESYKIEDKIIYKTKYLNILPDMLNITGDVSSDHLHRGIFNVLVYNTKLHFSGRFDSISLPETEYSECEIVWNKAELVLGVSDTRGINQNILINWNDKQIAALPGSSKSDVLKNGVHVPLKVNTGKVNTFDFDIDLNGSGLLSFLPLGKETNVELTSTWPHPQFDGAYIPKKRNLTESGFEASWKVLQHSRNFPQIWVGKDNISDSAFGVELIEPVDVYLKSMRAVKYSMLFVILTFLVFLFSELIINKKAHPIQYIMVGAALCVFFSLLIALSEQISFNMAYLIASVTIIGMISLFSISVFQNTRVSLIVLLVLSVLFTFLFVIVQMADYSLIFGNVGLVIVLALVMYVSRKIDWYGEKKEIES